MDNHRNHHLNQDCKLISAFHYFMLTNNYCIKTNNESVRNNVVFFIFCLLLYFLQKSELFPWDAYDRDSFQVTYIKDDIEVYVNLS